ncbi:MAG: RsmD family RNA methyltransferase [Pseudomonadota bacterium]
MRITGGTLRGRSLPGRVGAGVRPTGARVREALFNILGNDLEGQEVLDATGGTGLLAFEAASRGACRVLVIERDRRSAAVIAERACALGLTARVGVRCGDALACAAGEGRFDLVFADPPYAEPMAPWLAALLPCAGRALVIEHAVRQSPPAAPVGWVLDTRRYGDTALSFYRPSAAVGEGRSPEER